MQKAIDRLQVYLKSKGISLNAFDKSIGAGNGYIGKQIKNKASIGVDVIEKIHYAYTDLNLYWLIAGEGEMISKKQYTLEKQENPVVNDTSQTYGACKLCTEKERVIDAQKSHILSLEKQLCREQKINDELRSKQ